MKIFGVEGMLLNLAFLKASDAICALVVYLQLQCQKQMADLCMLDTAVGQGSSTQNIFLIPAKVFW